VLDLNVRAPPKNKKKKKNHVTTELVHGPLVLVKSNNHKPRLGAANTDINDHDLLEALVCDFYTQNNQTTKHTIVRTRYQMAIA
jgi:hypothetical protein